MKLILIYLRNYSMQAIHNFIQELKEYLGVEVAQFSGKTSGRNS